MSGYAALKPPTKTSEYYAMVEALRKHHEVMAAQNQEIAAVLRAALPNARGKKLAALRLDLKIYARIVARKHAHIAALNLATAKAYTSAYNAYLDKFVNGGSAPGQKFNVDG
jgi:hypothetical protein